MESNRSSRNVLLFLKSKGDFETSFVVRYNVKTLRTVDSRLRLNILFFHPNVARSRSKGRHATDLQEEALRDEP